MIIKISKDLKIQEYWANGVELASIMGHDRVRGKRVFDFPETKKVFVHKFDRPVLLTDNYRIGKLKPTLRDTLFSLCMSRPRIVEYDRVSVYWDDSHKNVWCPSIDTVLFARALKGLLRGRKDIFRAAEIGCGSGFLSKFLLNKSRSLRSMLINDINPYAIKCAMDNVDDSRALFYAGSGLEKISSEKFDLLICNPPYIPRYSSIDDNPYEGVALLRHLVHDGHNYLRPGGTMVVNISSLCWDLAMDKKPKMNYRIIDKMEVPLKVNNVLNSPKWVKYLEKLGMKKKYKRGYEYWQKLYIVALQNKNEN